jgi:hypothetical protein
MGRKSMSNIFKGETVKRGTPVGQVGYDNIRENVDPHLKSKVLSTQEISSGATVLGDIEVKGTLSGGNITVSGDNLGNHVATQTISGATLYSTGDITAIGEITGDGVDCAGTLSGSAVYIVDPNYLGIRVTNTLAGTASKYGTFTADQQNRNAEPEGFLLMGTWGEASRNRIAFGGSYSSRNAATELSFYTAANTTTRRGTERMTLKSDGKFGVGTTAPPSLFSVSGGEIFIADQSEPSQPAGGSVLFASGGALYAKGSSGTVTKLADP